MFLFIKFMKYNHFFFLNSFLKNNNSMTKSPERVHDVSCSSEQIQKQNVVSGVDWSLELFVCKHPLSFLPIRLRKLTGHQAALLIATNVTEWFVWKYIAANFMTKYNGYFKSFKRKVSKKTPTFGPTSKYAESLEFQHHQCMIIVLSFLN